MYFQELQQKLIDLATQKVRTGQVTERGLARRSGVSQPHMHNVLKGIRGLSMDSADRLMSALEVRASDLIWQGVSPDGDSKIRAVPIVRNRIGPGSDASLTVFRGHMPLPAKLLESVVEPLTARLAPDLVMPAALRANDLVLLDQNPAIRINPEGGAWIVASGAGLRVRYVRVTGARLWIGSSAAPDAQGWQSTGLLGRNILEMVRARIVWIGREMGMEPGALSGPAQGGAEDDPGLLRT